MIDEERPDGKATPGVIGIEGIPARF